jgi:hypothetical protein
MDYKKEYREALSRAKGMWEQGMMPERIEYIFPELKESEDEKNIKDLIDELKCSLRAANCQNEYCNGGHEKRIALLEWAIAWLKNQGKKSSWKPSKEEMDVLYGLSYVTDKFDERKEEVIMQLYQDLKREFFNGASFENMFLTSVELEKQGEQKLFWSKEDEETLREIICEIEANKSRAPDYDNAAYDRFLSWLKSIKDRVRF